MNGVTLLPSSGIGFSMDSPQQPMVQLVERSDKDVGGANASCNCPVFRVGFAKGGTGCQCRGNQRSSLGGIVNTAKGVYSGSTLDYGLRIMHFARSGVVHQR